MKRVYMDYNATTPVLPEVLEAMRPYLSGRVGNPSSLHQEGQQARAALEEAREKVAELIDADPKQVIFTSGGTESNNIAIFALAGVQPAHVVTTRMEHPSVARCFDRLEELGFNVERLAVTPAGTVDPELFEQRLRPETVLTSVMLVNNETGVVQPIEQLAAAARRRRVWFHTDAAQAVGKIPVSFRKLGVAALSIAGHKFNAPTGIGALVALHPDRIRPLLLGGHQENGRRPGTEPVALAVGLAKALELACDRMEEETKRLRRLRERFESRLKAELPQVSIVGAESPRTPNTSYVYFPTCTGQAMVVALDLEGVACSSGSACASGSPQPSPTLLAMGWGQDEARRAVRFSMGLFTSEEDVDRAADAILRVAKRLAAQSSA